MSLEPAGGPPREPAPSPPVLASGPLSLPVESAAAQSAPSGPHSLGGPPREPAPSPPHPASLSGRPPSQPASHSPAGGVSRARAPSPPPPELPPRGLTPSVRNIPSIPCSTGAVPVPGAAMDGWSAQQQSRRHGSPLGYSPAQSSPGRRPAELPRSLSHTADMSRRLSEMPRSQSFQPGQEAPAAPSGRRISVTRTEALAQEALRYENHTFGVL